MSTQSNTVAGAAHHASPNLGAVATVFTVLKVSSILVVSDLAAAQHFPSPLQPAREIVAYFAAHPSAVLICAFLQFGAAIPLGIFTAAMVSRLRFLGISAAGAYIALFGGFAAAFDMTVSALIQWVIVHPAAAPGDALVPALYYLQFGFGGPGYSVPLGLLLAGVSIPAGFMRLLPKWVVALGLVIAVIGELSWLSLVVPRALFLIPLTRFPAFIWLIAAGFAMPQCRARSIAQAAA